MEEARTYVVECGTRISERNDLDGSVLSLLNQSLRNINLRAQISLSGRIVKLWGESNVEGGDLVAKSEVDSVVSPWVAEVKANRAAGEWPCGTVGRHAGDVGAGEDVLVGSFSVGIASHLWIGDAEVGGCGGGEGREAEDGDKGLHCEDVDGIIE